MKAAVAYQPCQPLVIEELSIDKPKAREILVRVVGSGLCHSDLHFMKGYLPFTGPSVFGHEVAGVVEQVGSDVSGFVPGDHVVVCGSGFCGHCSRCVSGSSHLCADKPTRLSTDASRLSLNGRPILQNANIGGFAEQVLVHENWAVPVTRDLPLDRAALLGCGVLTGLGSVFNAAKVTPGSRVVVVGCGGVGLNIVQGARIAGAAQIIAVDLAPEKLELAKKLGATEAMFNDGDAVATVHEITKGGVDFAFEAIGRPTTIEQSLHMLRPGGLLTLVGATRIDETVALPSFATLINEWRVQGSLMGSAPFIRDIPRFADMYLKGLLDIDSLVAERISLADIDHGYALMQQGSQARSVIVFD